LCWTWSAGPSCAGSISFAAFRLTSWSAGRGWRATRSGRRCGQSARRCIGGQGSSKLDPFKDEIHRLLEKNPRLSGVRVRELIEPWRFDGGKTIVDDYLREIRHVFLSARTHQRTVYRPGEACQWDLWEPSERVPVGHGQLRRGWVVVCCLGYSRWGAGALIFSKEAPDVLWGMSRCVWQIGALPELLVIVHRAVSAGFEGPTKSWQARFVPLADNAASGLARLAVRGDYTARDDHVFCSRLGRRLDGSAARRRYKAARTAAGLRPLRFHALRHAAGSLVAREAGAHFVQAFLGHSRLSTTERYLHAKARLEDVAILNRAFAPTSAPAVSGIRDAT
jgi:hypothetical protein